MGHNWLAILYNKTATTDGAVYGSASADDINLGFPATFTMSSSYTGAPGGCARCHIAGSWKQKVNVTNDELDITGKGNTWSGTGLATDKMKNDIVAAITGAYNPDVITANQKKANTIECMLCHSSNYYPSRLNPKAVKNQKKQYGSGVDTRIIWNGGARKPGYLASSFGGFNTASHLTDVPATMLGNMQLTGAQDIFELESGTFKKVGSTGVGLLPDLADNARKSISKTPSNEACMRCHDFAGGGARNKRGMWFRQGYDVHASLSCLDCHQTEKMLTSGTGSSHKMSIGLSSDIWARDIKIGATYLDRKEHASECNNDDCHGNRPHSSKLLNDHYDGANDATIGDGRPSGRVDCRTCHIPYQWGQATKDFSKPTFDTITGLFDPETTNRTTKAVDPQALAWDRPDYIWYNGSHTGHGPATVATPFASTEAKITPFTNYWINNVTDAAANKIPIKFGTYAQTGSIAQSITAAPTWDADNFVQGTSLETNLPAYSKGDAPAFAATTNHFLLGHRVQPKASALKCADCHSDKAFFTDLGYDSDDADTLITVGK